MFTNKFPALLIIESAQMTNYSNPSNVQLKVTITIREQVLPRGYATVATGV